MHGEQYKSLPFTLVTNLNVFNEVLAMLAAYPWEDSLTDIATYINNSSTVNLASKNV